MKTMVFTSFQSEYLRELLVLCKNTDLISLGQTPEGDILVLIMAEDEPIKQVIPVQCPQGDEGAWVPPLGKTDGAVVQHN